MVEMAEMVGSRIGDGIVGDHLNNALDLMANALGALVATFVIAAVGDGDSPVPALPRQAEAVGRADCHDQPPCEYSDRQPWVDLRL